MGAGGARRALVLVADLMLGSRVEQALRGLGWTIRTVRSSSELAGSLAEPFALLIADINEAPLGPLEAIRAARSAGACVLAFGSHVDERALQAAREAGADLVVPRSAMAGGLSALIESLPTAGRSFR